MLGARMAGPLAKALLSQLKSRPTQKRAAEGRNFRYSDTSRRVAEPLLDFRTLLEQDGGPLVLAGGGSQAREAVEGLRPVPGAPLPSN